MRIYIAGPYTKGDVAENVRRAMDAYDEIADKGHTPFCPHHTHFQHFLHPRSYEFWLAQDMEWLELCDAVLRLPGESNGADKEVKRAGELGLIIYFSMDEIPDK